MKCLSENYQLQHNITVPNIILQHPISLIDYLVFILSIFNAVFVMCQWLPWTPHWQRELHQNLHDAHRWQVNIVFILEREKLELLSTVILNTF